MIGYIKAIDKKLQIYNAIDGNPDAGSLTMI